MKTETLVKFTCIVILSTILFAAISSGYGYSKRRSADKLEQRKTEQRTALREFYRKVAAEYGDHLGVPWPELERVVQDQTPDCPDLSAAEVLVELGAFSNQESLKAAATFERIAKELGSTN